MSGKVWKVWKLSGIFYCFRNFVWKMSGNFILTFTEKKISLFLIDCVCENFENIRDTFVLMKILYNPVFY